MTRPRRLLWIVNHRTLMPAEVPILMDLGFEVMIPKIIPHHDAGYRSGVVTYDYDSTLSVSPAALQVLNHHDFYERSWSPTLTGILNEQFDVVVTTISGYLTPLRESARHFDGTLVARVFGLEHPRRYAEYLLDSNGAQTLLDIRAMGERFVFGQGFANLADVEPTEFKDRAHTITVPLPPAIYDFAETWSTDASTAILLCPGISDSDYYLGIYNGIKRDFGDLPHVIFGRQSEPVDDPAVLPYLSDAELVSLYAAAPVFIYPSTEPRHVHYSPIEAMVIGTPVLYRRGALIDTIAGSELPGACADTGEMHAKARALLSGDRSLGDSIRASQQALVDEFSIDLAADQWAAALSQVGDGQ
jgi:hypothetical protein